MLCYKLCRVVVFASLREYQRCEALADAIHAQDGVLSCGHEGVSEVCLVVLVVVEFSTLFFFRCVASVVSNAGWVRSAVLVMLI